MKPSPIVALLTDFGDKDSYVGVVKAEILKKAPSCQIVDLTHKVPAQDVRSGAFQLLSAYKRFPAQTLFLAVVDPGVGTTRRVLAAEAGDWRFVAPDNGLLSWVFAEAAPKWVRSVSIAEGEKVSATFHARDVMAPLAGAWAHGSKEPQGPSIPDWLSLEWPSVKKTGSLWKGEVVSGDQYGNLITNLKTEEVSRFAKNSTVWANWEGLTSSVRGVAESYERLPDGRPGLIPGSLDFLEIAVKNGSAQEATGLKPGDPISLEFKT